MGELLDILDGLESIKPNVAIVGIDEFGKKVLNYFKNYGNNTFLLEIDSLNYNIDDVKEILDNQLAVIVVGDIDDKKIDLINNISNILKDDNCFNFLFNSYYGKYESKYNDELKFIIYNTDNTHLIYKTILNVLNSIHVPGLIGMDIIDIKYLFKDVKSACCYYNEGYNENTVIDDILYRISQTYDLNSLENMFVVIDNVDIRLRQVENIINRIREKVSKNISIIYSAILSREHHDLSIMLIHDKIVKNKVYHNYKTTNALISKQDNDTITYKPVCPHCGYSCDWLGLTVSKNNGEKITKNVKCYKCGKNININFTN